MHDRADAVLRDDRFLTVCTGEAMDDETAVKRIEAPANQVESDVSDAGRAALRDAARRSPARLAHRPSVRALVTLEQPVFPQASIEDRSVGPLVESGEEARRDDARGQTVRAGGQCPGWRRPLGRAFDTGNLRVFDMTVYRSRMGQRHRRLRAHRAMTTPAGRGWPLRAVTGVAAATRPERAFARHAGHVSRRRRVGRRAAGAMR